MIHTPTPKITLTESIIDRFCYSKEEFYRSTLKKLPKIRAFSFENVSTFGAELHVILENKETEQFSKKKIRWSDLVYFFYGERKTSDKAFCKEFKQELFKHALLTITKGESHEND